jgi:hypothetical protein
MGVFLFSQVNTRARPRFGDRGQGARHLGVRERSDAPLRRPPEMRHLLHLLILHRWHRVHHAKRRNLVYKACPIVQVAREEVFLMKRVEGYYWVREQGNSTLIIAIFREGAWAFGDGDSCTNETALDVIDGPLAPPSDEKIRNWKTRYQQTLDARKNAEIKDPTGGWDWMDGYYWVRVGADPAPILAQYCEGWGTAAGDQELDDKIKILDGPLIPPALAKPPMA